MSYEYVCEHYNVPACYGRMVTVDGQPGIIAADRGNYIGVNFAADRPGNIENCHPTWRVVYGGMGTVRRMTRSQRRYREYLDSDCGLSFREWLGIGG